MFTSGTEITTAVTDLMNGFIALIPLFWLLSRKPRHTRHKAWAVSYLFFILTSVMGFVMHGFIMPKAVNLCLWCMMYPIMSVMLVTYLSAVTYELDGRQRSRSSIAVSLITAFLVSAAAAVFRFTMPKYSYLVFSVYCTVNMVYIVVRLLRKIRQDKIYTWYLIAILFNILGSVFQAVKSIHFTVIWEFNYNSIYHFMACLFVLIQFKGIRLTDEQQTTKRPAL